ETKREEGGSKKQITINIPSPTVTLDLGPNFQMKLVILGLFAIVFVFSLYLFSRAGFAMADLFDLQRIQYNLPKLWSVSTIVFLALYGIAVGLATYYGSNLPRLQSILLLIVAVIIAGAVGMLYAPYTSAFFGLAIACGAAALTASFAQEFNWHVAWSSASKAMTILLILAVVFTFSRVSAEKERYTDLMFAGIAGAVPDMAGSLFGSAATQARNACASAVEGAPITREVVESKLTKASLRTAMDGSAEFAALPDAAKTSLVDGVQPAIVNQTLVLAGEVKTSLADGMRNYNPDTAGASAAVASLATPKQLKAMFSSVPQFKQMLDLLPVMMALSVASIVGLLAIVIKVIATIAAFGMSKALSE
ncbi:MAG: hypothetical protein AABW54_04275, partial [Candidatus Micrarchaeota archaeon]